MADEITVSLKMFAENGNYVSSRTTLNRKLDQAAAGERGGIQNIGTTEETLDSTGLTTPGLLFVENLDTTNYVEIGVLDGGSYRNMGRLVAGESAEAGGMCLIPVAPSVTVQLKANTAACNVRYAWLEA